MALSAEQLEIVRVVAAALSDWNDVMNL